MALVNRVARLFKADFNAVLDQIEEPEQLLKQAIRDMEDELAANEHRIAVCARDQETLTVRRNELQSTIEEISGHLDLCFDADKDELARPLIRKKLEAERIHKTLDTRCAANNRALAEQRKMLDENRVTLEGLRQKSELVSHRTSGIESGSDYDDIGWMSRELSVGDEEVEIAYLREKASRGAA